MLVRINEAVNVLVMDRSIFSNESIVREVFPTLNPVQLMHLLDSFRPDEYPPPRPSSHLAVCGSAIAGLTDFRCVQHNRVSSEPVPTEAKQLLARMAGKARNTTMFLQFDTSVLLPSA
jgi:hypothetical protein